MRLDGVNVSFSDHALERLVEMKVSAHVVRLALTEPDQIVPSVKYAPGNYYVRGALALAVQQGRGGRLHVVTAVFSSNKAWKTAAKQGRLGADRRVRHIPGLP